ncbi:MAG TPA: aldose epimerase family protein [Candidatus Acidoferrales bacterium]|jgi:aldose 1-epimerase|nr:aldose epimerase family protein [Candidatus Acidoferrales bacterium]
MNKVLWGTLANAQDASVYKLLNLHGMEVAIADYGATIVSLKVPDRFGNVEDVILGYDNISGYIGDTQYLGASIGRYANRIGQGEFVLDGTEYALSRNDGKNTLHGGFQGFNKKLWRARLVRGTEETIEFQYESPDGEEGFPGTLTTRIVFTLTATNKLRINYRSTTDKPTVVNLTNHAYFNLAGPHGPDILEHKLSLNANYFLPCNKTQIPTGEIASVRNTPFDFRASTAIGAHIHDQSEQLRIGKGFDHNWILNAKRNNEMAPAAEVIEPISGRTMRIFTTEPGIQFYSGNVLKNCIGREGRAYQPYDAFCLETQHFPDSPNRPEFPSATLRPGEEYNSTTIYSFSQSHAPSDIK